MAFLTLTHKNTCCRSIHTLCSPPLQPGTWKKVLCSDETEVKVLGHRGQSHIWCEPYPSCQTENTIVTVKHGSGRGEKMFLLVRTGKEEMVGAEIEKFLMETSLSRPEM